MLPATSRLTARHDFASTLRRGPENVRVADRTLVVHVAFPAGDFVSRRRPYAGSTAQDNGPADVRVGLVVSRAVGGAVTRNRVKRRLRALARELLTQLPDGTRVVLRAQPEAAAVPFSHLERSLHGLLASALDRRRRRPS